MVQANEDWETEKKSGATCDGTKNFDSNSCGLHGDKNGINNGKRMKERAKEFFSFTAPLPSSESELTELTA